MGVAEFVSWTLQNSKSKIVLLEKPNDSLGSGPRCLKKQATASSTPSVWGCSTRRYAPVDLSQGKLLNVNVNLRREDFQISQCQCQPTDVADWSIKRFTLGELHRVRSLQIFPVPSQHLDVALVRLILLLSLFVLVILLIVFGRSSWQECAVLRTSSVRPSFSLHLFSSNPRRTQSREAVNPIGWGYHYCIENVMLER